MVDTLLRHGTNVEGNVGQGVGISEIGLSRAGPSHTENPHRSPDPTIYRDHTGHVEGSERHVMPHPCTSCGNICYGPYLEFCGDGLLQYVSQTRSSHSLLFFVSQLTIVS